ncbi:MAG: polysaccharide deacetylase [Bacteroidetes bacterium]|nr:MAG: polysaccharide deacetylase [Bacteroidota bacterium]
MGKGKFVISLDFELHWGAIELWNLNRMKPYFDNTINYSVPHILHLFKKYDIHATWATVGFLFAKNKKQLLNFCPLLKPTYVNKNLSPYSLIENNEIGWDEKDDPYHFAYSLINQILSTPHQELASHTFGHYYCNEVGQNELQFDADLKSAQGLSKENFGIELQSLVFPRNQFNESYLTISSQNGIKVVRSNPDVWFWRNDSVTSRLARAVDTLLPIAKPNSFKEAELAESHVLLLAASRFLRPYTQQERLIHYLKFQRIKKEMLFAAKNNMIYHLWWHPHNFGYSINENLIYLEEILKFYTRLRGEFQFSSNSMIELY